MRPFKRSPRKRITKRQRRGLPFVSLRGETLEIRALLDAALGSEWDLAAVEWFDVAPRDANASDVPLVGSIVATSGSSARPPTAANDSGAAQWIVQLTDDAIGQAQSFTGAMPLLETASLSFNVMRGLGSPGLLLLETICQPFAQVRNALAANPAVRFVELDSTVRAEATPNDPLYSQQHALDNTGQSGGEADSDLDAPEAWEIDRDSSSIVIGVVDSGVDYTHPDLFQNIWLNQAEIPLVLRGSLVDADQDGDVTLRDLNQPANASIVADSNTNGFIDAGDILADPRWADTIDTDGNGFSDDLFGWDFLQNDNTPFDEHRHGTHVTGILGATGDNGIGISGVSWRSTVMPLRFLGATNEGSNAHAIAAINYATLMRTRNAADVRVLNASWGGGTFSEALEETIALAGSNGILTVAAAGNGDILGRGVELESQPFYPASYDLDSIISVAASDAQDELARFSNFGRRSVDLAAPGVGIWSTEPANAYQQRNGTSMATPHVTGAVALVWSHLTTATPAQVKQAILATVDPLPQLANLVASGGRLNLNRALLFDPVAPTATLATVPNVTQAGGTSFSFSVTYQDDRGVEVASLDSSDTLVSRSGGVLFSTAARFVSVDASSNGAPRVATYEFTPPDGAWDFADNGTYRITLRPNQVRDTGNNHVGGRLLGSFQAVLPPPPSAANELHLTSLLDSVDADPGDGENLDAQGQRTLRAAVMEANARTGDDRILLPAGTFTLTLAGENEDNSATGDLDLTSNIEIVGAGAEQTIIDAASLDRVFHVTVGATVTLRGVTIRGGSVSGDGGGVLNSGTLNLFDVVVTQNSASVAGAGGGIANAGTLRLTNSQVTHNSAARGAGGIHSAQTGTTPELSLELSTVANNTSSEVGGIVNDGPLTITNSTIADNVANGAQPGALARAGGLLNGLFNGESAVVASISGSTISGNSSSTGVGGTLNGGTLTLTNSTLSGNVGGAFGGIDSGSSPLTLVHVTIANNTGDEVGGVSAVAASVHNSIIATNTARNGTQPDISVGPFTSLGHNLIGVEEGTTNFVHNTNGDQVGTLAEPLDPRLAPLADWGGPTKMHALFVDSLAIDTGEAGSLAEDQRGAERTLDGAGISDILPDIGAFEDGTYFVNDTTDAVDANLGDGIAVDADNRRTLRAAIQEANGSGNRNVIVIAPGTFGLSIAGRDEDQSATGDWDVSNPLSVIGAGRSTTVLDGQNLDRVFHIHRTDLELSDLLITQGRYDGSAGGGIHAEGNLILKHVDMSNNASLYGGAIYLVGANSVARIEDGTLFKNSAQSGGGIYVDEGQIEFVDVRLDGNSASSTGGAISISGATTGPSSEIQRSRLSNNRASDGGAIFFTQTSRGLTVVESSVDGNVATGTGGGIYSAGDSPPVRFERSLLANNVATGAGGGIYASGSGVVEFLNSTISGNRSNAYYGSGLTAAGSSRVRLESTTVAHNTGSYSGGVYLESSSTVTVLNSLIAENDALPSGATGVDVLSVHSSRLESLGATLIGRAPQGSVISTEFDLIGTIAQPIYARLGPLQDNGGPTWTRALRTGSPAIDAAVDSALTIDQRGVTRLDGDNDGTARPDIGAYEFEFGLPIRAEGIKFNDRDGDGVQDANESRLANWTVFADLDADGQLDAGEPSTITDDDGRYEFTGLDVGTYLIGEVLRPDWERTYPGTGRNDFVPFGTIPVGDQVQAVVAADLDGDGTADLATADFGANAVSIARNAGDGQFRPSGTVAVGRGPVDLVAADLDGDGDLDLATANFADDSITWLRNDGTNATPVTTSLPVGDGPRAIIAIDLDRDGDVDLLTADSLAGRVSILRNTGSGQFAATQFVSAGALPQDLVAADFDNDGDDDLAVVNLEAFTVTLLFNDDSGQLELFDDVDVGAFPRALAAGDLDGDGDTDIAVASSFSDSVQLLMNNGQGGFANAGRDLFVERTPRGIAIADVDHDGRPEVVVANSASSSLSVLRNLGVQNSVLTFATPLRVAVGPGPRGLTVADFDRDGHVDLVVANLEGNSLSVRRNAFGFYAESFVAGDLFRATDFGNRLKPGSLHGTKFHDLDADGVRDATEPGLSGWRIYLDANNNEQFDSAEPFTLSAGDGSFSFTGLEPLQVYIVREEPQAGWTQTRPADQGVGVASRGYQVEVGIGETVRELDFGNHGAVGEVRGVKFKDIDKDGVHDTNEPPLANWTIYIDLNTNAQFDGNEPSAVTNANGEYAITDLPAQTTFVVDEVPQTGWVKTTPPVLVEFVSALGLPIASQPNFVVTGDLEGDGDQDLILVVADGESQELLAFANNGQGRFSRKWSYVLSTTPVVYAQHLAVGDINKDGLLDVVLAEYVQDGFGSALLSVFLNQQSNDVVRDPIREFLIPNATELTVTDLNLDGAADIVFGPTTSSASDMQVLFNDGVGNFPTSRQTVIRGVLNSSFPTRLLSGDFNRDGHVDLATGVPSGGGLVLGIYFNRGDETFSPVALTTVSFNGILHPKSVADLDDDGDLDIVALNYPGSIQSFDLFRNRGDGTFEQEPGVPAGPNVQKFQLADLDGDSDLDLPYTYFDASAVRNKIAYLRNNGRGSFVSGAPLDEKSEATDLLDVPDLNGDGRADLLATKDGGLPAILLNDNSRAAHVVTLGVGESREAVNFGALEESSFGGVSTGGTSGFVFNDLDGDGRRDAGEAPMAGITVFVDLDQDGLLDANETRTSTTSDNPDTPNDETGSYAFDELPPGAYTIASVVPAGFTLTAPRAIEFQDHAFPTGDGPQAVAVADFDGDGGRDLAVANAETNNVSVLLNHGDATFAAGATVAAGFGPTAIATGDVNGDGRPDLLVANRLSNSMSVVRQRTDGTWLDAVTVALGGSPSSLVLTDLDGDGDLDAAVSLERQNQVQLLRNTAGVFAPYATAFVGRSPNGLHAADLDADGDMDLLTANFDAGNVSVLKNNGDGTFLAATNLGAGRGAFSVTTGDIDSDGDPDLLLANFLADTVSLLRNRGGGVFQAAEHFAAGKGPAAVAAVDLDLDGDLDLAVGNATTTNLSILFNTDGTFGAPANFGVGDFPKSLAFALAADDFDGDGDHDLAVASSVSNRVAILRTDIEPGPYRFTLNARQEVGGLQFGLRAQGSTPTISDISDQAVDEDRATGLLPFTVGDLETAAGQLVVTVNSSNAALVSDVNIALGGSGANRTVAIAPVAEQSGTAVITLTVRDADGATASDTFTLTVHAVNDPPTVALANTTTSLLENTDTASRLKVADVLVTDDALGVVSFSLSGTDAGLFEIDETGLFLRAGTVLNFETRTQLAVIIAVDDPAVGSTPDDSVSLTIAITDVVEQPSDADIDGVPSDVENSGPNGGDGNLDGTLDSEQPNVATLRSALNGEYVTVAVPTGTSLSNVRLESAPSSEDAPPSTEFPMGLLVFSAPVAQPGGQLVVTLYLEHAESINGYYKFGPTPGNATPHWYPFLYNGTTGAKLLADRIELYFVDGGRGDDDVTASGVVVDPGAPVIDRRTHPWQHPLASVDVNDDGSVSPLDALLIINELNLRGSHELAAPLVAPNLPPSYFDVSGDGVVSPLDALQVINDLNTNGPRSLSVTPAAEGEGAVIATDSIRWGLTIAALPTSNVADSRDRPNAPAATDLPEPESRLKFISANERSVVVPSVGSVEEEDSSDSWQELESILNMLAEDAWAARVSLR